MTTVNDSRRQPPSAKPLSASVQAQSLRHRGVSPLPRMRSAPQGSDRTHIVFKSFKMS